MKKHDWLEVKDMYSKHCIGLLIVAIIGVMIPVLSYGVGHEDCSMCHKDVQKKRIQSYC